MSLPALIEAVRKEAHDERNDRGPSPLQVAALALAQAIEDMGPCPVCGFEPKK